MLYTAISSLLLFLQENAYILGAVLAAVIIYCTVFYLTSLSIKNLKTEIFSAYPFDPYKPHSGIWSVSYFLILIIFLGFLMYLLINGNFYLAPA